MRKMIPCCPRCKGFSVGLRHSHDKMHIKCMDCGVGSELSENEDDAIFKWNCLHFYQESGDKIMEYVISQEHDDMLVGDLRRAVFPELNIKYIESGYLLPKDAIR